jgi:hypothetical protein
MKHAMQRRLTALVSALWLAARCPGQPAPTLRRCAPRPVIDPAALAAPPAARRHALARRALVGRPSATPGSMPWSTRRWPASPACRWRRPACAWRGAAGRCRRRRPTAGQRCRPTHRAALHRERPGAATAGRHDRWNNSAQLGVGWEPDLFGRQRAALDAAIGQQRAAQADAQAARVLLAGNVAAAWFNLARLLENAAWPAGAGAARAGARAGAPAHRRGAGHTRRAAPGRGPDRAVAGRDRGAGRSRRAPAMRWPSCRARARRSLATPRRAGRAALQPLPAAAGRPAGPARRPGGAALARRGGTARRRRGARAVLPRTSTSSPSSACRAWAWTAAEAGARTFGAGPALRLPVFDGGRLRAQLGARAPRPMPPSTPTTPRCCARCARWPTRWPRCSRCSASSRRSRRPPRPPMPPTRWRCSATRPAWATFCRADGRPTCWRSAAPRPS